jgi:type IV secretory pathway VirB2 component (pilin)
MISLKTSARSVALPVLTLFAPGLANAQNAPADPAGSQPINNAVNWVQGTLLGNVATTVAVIAVAMVGLMMLSGRMRWKTGATVIFGCFILFGATTIVAGIRAAAG